MNEALQEAIAGESVTVTLGGQSYPLAYPMQAVILYKHETALLDRARAKGRTPLTIEEKRSLRSRRLKLMTEADLQRPAKGVDWLPDNFVEFDLLLDEATALKVALDEDAGKGDSLYDMYNWRKISPDDDPERLLLALWIGLHHFVATGLANTEEQYAPRLSRQQLGLMVDLGNGGDLTMAISKALSAHLIARQEEIAEEEILGDPPRGDFELPNPPAAIPPQVPKGIEERRAQRRQQHHTTPPK